MFPLNKERCVGNWKVMVQRWVPDAVNTCCPHCHRDVSFPVSTGTKLNKHDTVALGSECPACSGSVLLLVVRTGPQNDVSQKSRGEIFIFPPPPRERKPVEGLEGMSNDALRSAYLDLLGVFNNEAWRPTAVCARVTLEGIVKTLAPAAKGTLGQRIREIGNHVQLAKPIEDLAHLVREGGNIGSHFDPQKIPDPELAEAMIDLVDYLMEYVYLLPQKIQRLKEKLDQWEGEEKGSSHGNQNPG